MKRAAVYCGAAEGINPIYKEQTIALGEWLLANNYELVYGGGKVGLMGIIADTILKGHGNVTGIMPKFLKDREIAHENLTTLEVVETMPERKTRMIDLADVFIALPGGPGTLEEISEVISLGRVAQHQNPCVLYNVAGYYDGLASFLIRWLLRDFYHKLIEIIFASQIHSVKLKHSLKIIKRLKHANIANLSGIRVLCN